MYMYVKNKKGFSFLELIIVVGIITVCVSVLSKLFVNQLQSVHHIQDQMSKFEFQSLMYSNLMNEDYCRNSLGNKEVLETQNLQFLKDENNNAIFQTTSVDQPSHDELLISDMLLENKSVPPGADQSGVMDLIFKLTRKRKGGGPSELITKVSIIVETDATGKIETCYAVGGRQVASTSQTTDTTSEADSGDCAAGETRKVYGTNYYTPLDQVILMDRYQVCVGGRWNEVYSQPVDRDVNIVQKEKDKAFAEQELTRLYLELRSGEISEAEFQSQSQPHKEVLTP